MGRVRIQSDSAVQQFGVLTFPYRGAFERLEIVEVHVRKPDGAVIVTADSDAQDSPTASTRAAPTYSDGREKQIPIKGLGAGDLLEWHIRIVRSTADVPGQFWYSINFFRSGIVQEETVRITVPADKYVKTGSPGLVPEIQRENGHVTYVWKTSQPEHAKEEARTIQPRRQPRPAIEITTFRSWEEVGLWYAALQKPQAVVTPAIQAKAVELTRGLNTATEKERALYQFVATKFRYISVSFGAGRFQPHTADEVLLNQYGDCKDKHTLFAAMLKAVGIEAWPALIGAGMEFDSDVPSPAQFNHLITYIPSEPGLWLDTTPEGAPFGMLQYSVRDQKALILPDNAAARVLTTPEDLPFAADQRVEVTSKLTGDGNLTGHFDFSVRGDDEVILKSLFHATPVAQWTQLAQLILAGMGFGGTASAVSVDNPTNTEAPFHYSYDYQRKPFSDWENLRFTAPLPPIALVSQGEEKPSEPVFSGALGQARLSATMELPEGYSATISADSKLDSQFASYSATYSVDKGVFSVRRTLVRKQAMIAPDDWAAFYKFMKSVHDEESRFIQLTRASGTVQVTGDSDAAKTLLEKASQLERNREYDAAQQVLKEAERINPSQTNLWASYGYLYGLQNQSDKAMAAFRKEIELHPGNAYSYQALAGAQQRLGRTEEALLTLRAWATAAPQNPTAVAQFAAALIALKRYSEAVDPLQAALKANPENPALEFALLSAWLRDGKSAEASSMLAKIRQLKLDPVAENEVAYLLADTNAELPTARELATKAVEELESHTGQSPLSALTAQELQNVTVLGNIWDTRGWVDFRMRDLDSSEKFLQAGWALLQSGVIADHLGQLYERQGKKTEAIHYYRLALAAQSNLSDTRERLQKLGAAPVEPSPSPARSQSPPQPRALTPQEELSKMRTTPIPGIAESDGHAEFFLLFSPKGVEEAWFITGDEKLRTAAKAFPKQGYGVLFPDEGPEKLPRRGILFCSAYSTPHCSLTLLLPGDTQP